MCLYMGTRAPPSVSRDYTVMPAVDDALVPQTIVLRLSVLLHVVLQQFYSIGCLEFLNLLFLVCEYRSPQIRPPRTRTANIGTPVGHKLDNCIPEEMKFFVKLGVLPELDTQYCKAHVFWSVLGIVNAETIPAHTSTVRPILVRWVSPCDEEQRIRMVLVVIGSMAAPASAAIWFDFDHPRHTLRNACLRDTEDLERDAFGRSIL